MQLNKIVRNLSLSLLVLAGALALPVSAQVYLNIGIAPPALQNEVLPRIPRGHVWVPGHWAWKRDHYVWVRGKTVVQRVGYVWVPDRWEQRGQYYYRNSGRWQRDTQYRPEQSKNVRPKAHRDNGNHFGQIKQGNHGNKANHGEKENHGNQGKHGKE